MRAVSFQLILNQPKPIALTKLDRASMRDRRTQPRIAPVFGGNCLNIT